MINEKIKKFFFVSTKVGITIFILYLTDFRFLLMMESEINLFIKDFILVFILFWVWGNNKNKKR
jgi:hypothetical protein